MRSAKALLIFLWLCFRYAFSLPTEKSVAGVQKNHASTAIAESPVAVQAIPNRDSAVLATQPAGQVRIFYYFKCGNEPGVEVAEFDVKAVYVGNHIHWEGKRNIDAFLNPASSAKHVGLTGFVHNNCINVDPMTKCTLHFAGQINADLSKGAVNISVDRFKQPGNIAPIVSKNCLTVIVGPPPACQPVGGPDSICKILNIRVAPL